MTVFILDLNSFIKVLNINEIMKKIIAFLDKKVLGSHFRLHFWVSLSILTAYINPHNEIQKSLCLQKCLSMLITCLRDDQKRIWMRPHVKYFVKFLEKISLKDPIDLQSHFELNSSLDHRVLFSNPKFLRYQRSIVLYD